MQAAAKLTCSITGTLQTIAAATGGRRVRPSHADEQAHMGTTNHVLKSQAEGARILKTNLVTGSAAQPNGLTRAS
jgi:hypothetical protein